MEIRLMDKNKDTGRFNNVEVYSEDEFDTLVANAVLESVAEIPWYKRVGKQYVERAINGALYRINDEFKARLKANKNR